MSNIIPFESSQLPAHLKQFQVRTDLVVAGGFPYLSIKGKTFHVHRGDDKKLVKNKDGDPASSIEVVILAYNPHPSRSFYKGKYVEGSNDKPDCYSDNGVSPGADAEHPQSKKCATCPQNVWGSRKTEDGKDAKACAETRRLAVAPAGMVTDPMLLRVPTTSNKALGEYQAMLAGHKAPIEGVVTRIRFDHEKAYPSLLFEPVGFVDEATAAAVLEQADTPLVKQIIGVEPVATAPEPAGELEFVPEAQEEAPKAESKPAAKPKAAKPKPKPEPEPEPEPEVDDGDSDDDDILNALDQAFGN